VLGKPEGTKHPEGGGGDAAVMAGVRDAEAIRIAKTDTFADRHANVIHDVEGSKTRWRGGQSRGDAPPGSPQRPRCLVLGLRAPRSAHARRLRTRLRGAVNID